MIKNHQSFEMILSKTVQLMVILTRPGHGGNPFILALRTNKITIPLIRHNRALFRFSLILKSLSGRWPRPREQCHKYSPDQIVNFIFPFGSHNSQSWRSKLRARWISNYSKKKKPPTQSQQMTCTRDENNGGCGVSVLFRSDGEEGTLNEHPSSRCLADERYRHRQCRQRKRGARPNGNRAQPASVRTRTRRPYC